MGQLNQTKLSRRGTAKVCPAGASLPAKPQKFSGPHGETLLERLSRLDSEPEMSRADVGSQGEPSLIEVTGDEPKTRELHYIEIVFVCERCASASRRVYRRDGQWFCLSCLRESLKQGGASRVEISMAAWNAADAIRQSSGLRRLDGQNHAPRPKDSHQ